MPSFEYSAIDRQGKSVQGQIQAGTRDEAALNLTRSGLLVSRLTQSSGVAPAPSSARPVAPHAPAISQSPDVRGGPPPILNGSNSVSTPAAARRLPSTAPSVTKPVATKKPAIRTKRGSDKDLYFIFSQLQSYAKSGINPVEALTNLGNSCPRRDYGEALLAAADAAKEGRPISDVLERYVDLFPPHVVGMVRAAEYGGFFPEAYSLLTDQAHASHKFRIWFRWLLGVTIMVAACFPIAAIAFRGALDSWDIQEKTGGTAPGMPTFLSAMFHQLVWPCGPFILLLIAGFWLYGLYWQSLPRRMLRHRLVLIVPSIAKRARAESLTVFAWTMGMLAKVGLTPKTVWELSVSTVPNLAIRHDMEETGSRMTEQTRLSEALSMSKQVPIEYAPIVQTGEVTGDVPTALLRASQTQLEEFKAGDQMSKARVGCWMFLIMGVGTALLFGIFYGNFYRILMDKILGN